MKTNLVSELARMRGISAEPPSTGKVIHETPYSKVGYYLRSDMLLDPERRVRYSWKRTPLAGTVVTVWPSGGPRGQKFDTFLGPDIAPENGVWKVRDLHRDNAGRVRECSAMEYETFRSVAINRPGSPLAEPVEDDEPLCGPALPSCFPETLALARKQMSEATGKAAELLKPHDVVAYFKKLEQPKTEPEILRNRK